MNEKFEEYLKNLSPELQERARSIKTKEELYTFIADNGLELPNEALEFASGGCGNPKQVCPQCGSTNILRESYAGAGYCIYCGNCGYVLHEYVG